MDFPDIDGISEGASLLLEIEIIREDAVVRCISGRLLQTRGVGPFMCLREKNLVDSGGMLRISNLAIVVYSSGQITYEVTGLL